MTHAKYKTRWCTCEHALSRTPTPTYTALDPFCFARSLCYESVRTLFFYVSMHGLRYTSWKLRGYRMGNDPNGAADNFGDPNRPERDSDTRLRFYRSPPCFHENHPFSFDPRYSRYYFLRPTPFAIPSFQRRDQS